MPLMISIMERRPVPIAEQLPTNGVDLLAYDDGVGWCQANYFPADDGSDPNDGVSGWHFVGDDLGSRRAPVTHWMPMPRAPR
jgi:hypothetical protein